MSIFYTMEKEMNDAMSLANYFIDKALSENKELTILKLLKIMYISHGYLLAMLDRSVLNPRFDKVEAWKFGPVIPSVYHTFKGCGSNPIKERATILCYNNHSKNVESIIPCLKKDEIVSAILDFVWRNYGNRSSGQLVDLLHMDGTPWHYYYRDGENVEIPDEGTKLYYQAVIRESTK